ncbi:ECF RNA polymerase sigma factor SigK [Acaricomes phytoseiuli]|uniref:ECF RNA polymerase sigma factor SigK n=2 Tax=Acaricomes phytoseiuli TaxID=291968 RepID=UPI001FDEEBD7|nr:ECF RNA polymerase sigma factor SigK [Acaricomes phytoseiuli]
MAALVMNSGSSGSASGVAIKQPGWFVESALRSFQGYAGQTMSAEDQRSAASTGVASLEELLAGVSRGGQAEFTSFYERTASRVYGLARRVVIDPALSQDVAQEVFAQVWEQAVRYRAEQGSALSWLMTITHRRAVDKVRSQQRAVDREQAYLDGEYRPQRNLVADAVEDRVESQQLRSCLEELTGMQRQSLQLAYFDGLTYREVAEKLEAGLPAVKARIRDGLIKLGRCMGVKWGDV